MTDIFSYTKKLKKNLQNNFFWVSLNHASDM